MSAPRQAGALPQADISWRIRAILLLAAFLPAAVYGVLALICGAGSLYPAAAALAAAAVTALFAARSILNGIALPVSKMALSVKEFIAGGYRLGAVIPKEGWPEAAGVAVALNRLMLELSAFRGFHLNQVVEEKAKAQALVETIADGVMLLDDRGRVISCNQVALNMLGITLGDQEVSLPDSVRRDPLPALLSRLMASPDDYFKAEAEVLSEDGSCSATKSLRVTSRRFPLATLKRPGRVLVIRDVTAEKEIESARETFFHMITHDMRAPLTSIQGYAQLMQNHLTSPEAGRCLQAILRSSKRLKGMIEDILNMIKLERGEMELQLVRVDAAELCARVFEVYEPLASAKKMSFATSRPPGDISFAGDSDLLERVLSNLVGNSLKFTPVGGRVGVSCRKSGAEVLFCVDDSGPGVPKDKQKEIFEKHCQMEEHKRMGFGLGLTMCRMVVELHKGRVWVESEEGKGSRFYFSIPAR